MVNNPFDLKNYKSQVDMKDVSMAVKSSYQASFIVNQKRQQGKEPSAVHLPGSQDVPPKQFALDMPVMPVGRRALYKRRRKLK